MIYRQNIILEDWKEDVLTVKNNHNGSNYDHDAGDDDEKNENDNHCCHCLDSCCIKLVLLFSGTPQKNGR